MNARKRRACAEAGDPLPSGTTRLRVILAAGAVWLIWGSTYLAIRFAIETLPPFLMSGVRFLAAGGIVLAVLRWRGTPAPTASHWRSATIVGALLLLCGNGAVVWAERSVPSGLVALTAAIVPAWMSLFDWISGGPRPTAPLVAGLALGFLGVGILMTPDDLLGRGAVDPLAALVVIGGSMAWAAGSIHARSVPLPPTPLMSTALQMICGGAWLLAAGLLSGELADLHPAAVTSRSLLAWGYLMIFGSIVAFSAYVYLLRHTEPAKASTYAFVNPVIAVLLGWALAGEPLNRRVGLAVAAIVPAVALIVTFRRRPRKARPPLA